MKIHLNKLELHGFKSFPEKTVIKFHPGITAVVGPNGCGKSNIVDALLWVLGEQRIKNLRGENNEDLIFSGSSSKKPLGMTEVGVTFSNAKDDTYIARRFFRSGDSKYILNEKYCRNKDIQEELYNLNLGGRNYFIFEQGSIEKLVSLKPSERRMLIEEAAGISQYLLRKKETASKLIIAEQNLDNLEILSADKENRLRELKNQANYAARYRTLKSENIEYIKVFLYKKFHKINKDFEKRKEAVEKYLNSEMIITKELGALEKEYTGNESRKWELDKTLKEKQKELFELNQDILSKKSEVEKLNQRKEFIVQKIDENKKSIEENKKIIESREKRISGLESEVKTKKGEYESFQSEYNSKKDEISGVREEYGKFSAEKEKIRSDIFAARSSLAALNNEIHENEKLTVKLENEINSKQTYIRELKETIEDSRINEEEEKFNKAESLFSDSERSLSELKSTLDENRKRVQEINSGIRINTNDIQSLKKQKQNYLQMKEKVTGEKTPSGRKLQDILSSEKANFGLIENFYFDEIGSYIAENDEDLRNTALEKVILNLKTERSVPLETEKEEGFIDHIKNLFKLKEPALKNILKDGVVVTDIEKGINIYKKFRVPIVTKNGEIITSDGVLIRTRNTGVLNIVEEIRNIETNIADAENKIIELTKELESENEKGKGLEEKFDRKSVNTKELERESIRARSDLDNMINAKEKNLKRIHVMDSELERHRSDIEKFSLQLKEKKKVKSDLEKNNVSLTQNRESLEKREETFTKNISEKEKEFFGLENKLNLAKEKFTSGDSELNRLKRELKSLKEDIEKNERENSDLKAEIENISGNISKFSNERSSHINVKGKSEETIKGSEQTLDELNTRIKKENELLTTKRSELDEIKEAKSREEIELAALKKDIFSLEEISFKELNSELKDITPDDKLLELEVDDLEEKVSSTNERLIRMRDSNRLNFSAESEYDLLAKDHEVLLSQKSDVLDSIEDMNNAINKIDDESKASFKEAFEEIRGNFRKTFEILFEGGEADLQLTDLDNILETGLEIMAQPPGKRLQGLRLLSGGEKTLTSLAFLFALFEYKPSPFCVFDEVDASLDEANIQRFLKFLHKLKEKTQFLIITHNFKTMEEADFIYGISMNEPSVSTVYSMKMTSNNGLTSQ
ncbi:MAG: chromosome segregation protein SMC [Acidobacteriota bacterium]